MAIENLLPANFGYAIFTYMYSFVMLSYLALQVGGARKKYGIKVGVTCNAYYSAVQNDTDSFNVDF